MVGVTLPLYLREEIPLAHQEEGMLEHLVGGALPFRLVEVVHVQLPDERGEVIVFEVLREDLLPEESGVPDDKALPIFEPSYDVIDLFIIYDFVKF